VQDAFDDLLDAPWIDAVALLESERVIGRLELRERTRRPGSDMDDRL